MTALHIIAALYGIGTAWVVAQIIRAPLGEEIPGVGFVQAGDDAGCEPTDRLASPRSVSPFHNQPTTQGAAPHHG